MKFRAPKFSGGHRHSTTHTTKAQNRKYEGRHRNIERGPDSHEGIHRAPEPASHRGEGRAKRTKTRPPIDTTVAHDGVWYPTQAQWEQLAAGKTVKGHRLQTPAGKPPPAAKKASARANIEGRSQRGNATMNATTTKSLWWGSRAPLGKTAGQPDSRPARA